MENTVSHRGVKTIASQKTIAVEPAEQDNDEARFVYYYDQHPTEEDLMGESAAQSTLILCFPKQGGRLRGWRLTEGALVEQAPDEQGRLWSSELESYLVADGALLRLTDRDGQLRLTEGEAERAAKEAAWAKLRELGIDPAELYFRLSSRGRPARVGQGRGSAPRLCRGQSARLRRAPRLA